MKNVADCKCCIKTLPCFQSVRPAAVSMHFHLMTDIDGSCMVEAGGTSVLRDGCKGVPENTDPCEETLK